MKLPVPFIQLPLMFDTDALVAEIATFDESEWRPHPDGIPGNSSLPLASVEGDPARGDELVGPMRATPNLDRSPYMRQVLGQLQCVLGRIRLMRLAGQADVAAHVDTNYYWNERVRVHVPITTQPGVIFHCDDAQVHMGAGECWLFDTWRMHRVENDSDAARVHLVIDTIGSPAFWRMVNTGLPHGQSAAGWQPRRVDPQSDVADVELAFESVNSCQPMSYWELRGHVSFLLGESQRHPGMPAVVEVSSAFVRDWQALWFRYGESDEGHGSFLRLLELYLGRISQLGADIVLQNGVSFAAAAIGLFRNAVSKPDAPPVTEESSRSPAAGSARRTVGVRTFDRPVFIVSSPRSGSSLLFETLSQGPGTCTLGGEGHGVIEGMAALNVKQRGYDSNRLLADDATDDIVAQLRARFAEQVRDRNGAAPAGTAIRLLEKTPKNALRIPFLLKAFPDARFIYLHRDPREVLASMMEAWESGGFRTYPGLPGWTGLPWSMLLIPGWRELIDKPLAEIVAAQWEVTTRTILDDLASLAADRCHVARHDVFLADPNAEIRRICTAMDLNWDRDLSGPLPLADHTVSEPRKDKWRRRESEIMPALAAVSTTVARAAQVAEQGRIA